MDKFSILYHYLRAKWTMRLRAGPLRKWQSQHLEKIVRFARQHSPFYHKNLGKVISKKTMMEHFSTFNTKGIEKEKAFQLALSAEEKRDFDKQLHGITVGLSSGTSGNRGIFLVSKKERNAWCGNILAKILPKPPWKKQKIALFLRANSPLYETICSRSLTFKFFDLIEDPEKLKEQLKSFQPDVLVAPPSMLLMLEGICNPIRVISIAETLFKDDEKRLEKIFQQKIFQIYQCTEGFLGFTCSHGTLHLNEDLLIIEKEYLDERRFIPIITDLFRKTQPIIRYRLDDILVEKGSLCPCGCPFEAIEQIEGRCDDLLYVETKENRVKPLFPDFVNRRIISSSEEIEEYAVVQTQLNQWKIYLNSKFHTGVRQRLFQLFDEVQCIRPHLDFINERPTREKGAKRRRIRNAIDKKEERSFTLSPLNRS